jgi:ABC-type lipoprotein export system ATPase subunit
MIKLNNIYKYYDSKFQRTFVLKNIDLEISEGEFITIMGPSGAGKSTLLNIIGMLDEPNEGEYYFFDRAAHSINEKGRVEFHRNYMGFIFQACHLIDKMTVYENTERGKNRWA